MTKAERQKMLARERAARHYQKKKLERANSNAESTLENEVEHAPELDSRHLSLVAKTKPEDEVNEPVESNDSTPDLNAVPEEKAPDSPPPPIQKKSGWRTFGLVARGVVIAALTVLMAMLQADFYSQHDVSPQLAWPFAIAVEAGFISLVTMKFAGWFDLVRKLAVAVVFLYFAATLVFQIAYRARENVIRSNSVGVAELQGQLEDASQSLKVAEKGRSWENMRLFGEQVRSLQSQIANAPKTTALGTTRADVLLAEAVLLVVMRVILLAVSGLNTVRLRESLAP